MQRSVLLIVLMSLLVAGVAGAAAARNSGTSPIDGRWQWTWTKAELARGPKPYFLGTFVAEYRDGRQYSNYPKPGSALRPVGTFTVQGDVVSLRFNRDASGVDPGKTYMMRFSIFRDRLTWSKVPGRAGLDTLPLTPWTRVG
jgi:hypothetical protein